ncbi:MAG: tetratricopeptide repeat protein [Syntrophobacterales bacterium]|nr:MAG: tetratricopeptide repeat protein [Syntrophobacterales bacterium]
MNLPKEHLFDIAQKYIKKGQHKKAIKEYRKILAKDPKNIRVRLKLGDLCLRNGYKDDAIDEYMKVAQQYENDDLNFRATAIYKKILYLDPQLVDVYHKLANLYLRENLIGSAKLQYHNILKIRPNDPVASEALEKIEQKRVQVETPPQEGLIIEPPPMVEESGPEPTLPSPEEPGDEIPISVPSEIDQETGEKDFETHYHLGIAYKEMELIDHAIAEFEAASADKEKRFDCLVMLGMCFMEKEEYDKAINCFNDASHVKKLNKEEAINLHYRLGLAYESNGMIQEAVKVYQQVINLDSEFMDVRNRIERLKRAS